MKIFKMDVTNKVRHNLDSVIKYLSPLLPLANCHMVEFITNNHWENLLPKTLRDSFEDLSLEEATESFWKSVTSSNSCNPELDKWTSNARFHYVTVDNEFCLTRAQFEERIRSWGGTIKPQVKVTEFMNSKKSYEVQTMCGLVATLHEVVGSSCCVEAGGGRGPLLTTLSLSHGLHSLTVDCDHSVIQSARARAGKMQKQWHAIAKRLDESEQVNKRNSNLHRFASAYVTKETDLADYVRQNFPEFGGREIKLLLTGLHTCGNLGPDSLRIFTSQPSTAAVFNVPCCYHLLTEDIDEGLFDVFQRDYGLQTRNDCGFPMSSYLKGLNLGRNARMLAAQSIDRVVHLQQLPAKSLLYRAVLQVIIKDNIPNAKLLEGKLKRVSKCENFEQYFKMADSILNLNLHGSLPAIYLAGILNKMEDQWRKLVLFYLLRLCLAQVVESVILLDRLLYLLENGFKKVYLVKLFDPVLSPRCHSIVALRNNDT